MKFFGRILLPLGLLIYIGVETWLKLHHASLCNATGCKLAGALLRFPSLYLNYMGMAAAAALLILGSLSLRSRWSERLFFVVLYSAIAFESIMIGYQILVNPEPCLFCLGVYATLLLIALTSGWKYFLAFVPVIVALFLALSTLSLPRNAAMVHANGRYLIHSQKCPHCKKVIAFFRDRNISFHSIPVSDPNAKILAATLDIREIPILIIQKGARVTLLHGDREIIEHFAAANTSDETEPASSSKEAGAGNLSGPNEGCSLDEVESGGGCEESPEIPLR